MNIARPRMEAEGDRTTPVKVEREDGRGGPNPSSTPPDASGDVEKYEGRCDVCQRVDGFRGNNLQKCKACQLLVHEQCYGKVATEGKDPDFVCHACEAVGAEVEVNVPSRVGGSRRMGERHAFVTQTERPTECVLCSHEGGNHAMHPLLDVHGPDGRQLVLRAKGDGANRKEKRLAWVHTLCASVICSYPQVGGCVYGCFEDKTYEEDGSEEEDEEEDEEAEFDGEKHSSKNSESEEEDSSTDQTAGKHVKELRYYAIAGKDNGESTIWSKKIEENRGELVCIICGKQNVLQIPLQCIAGEENERKDFLSCHPNLYQNAGTECSVAMHVGCARWGYKEVTEGAHLERVNGIPCRLCYFWPSKLGPHEEEEEEKEEDALVPHCYCSAHAREIVENHPHFKQLAKKAAAAAASNNSRAQSSARQEDVARRIVTPGRAHSSRGAPADSSERSPGRHPRAIISVGGPGRRLVSPQRTESGPPGTRQASAARSSGRSILPGLNTLKPRKRKESVRHEPAFGSAGPKRKKAATARANAKRFPVRGRAAAALAGSPSPGRSPAGRKKPSPAPDLPLNVDGGTKTEH